MIWALLTLSTAILFAATNIIDKHVITDEIRDPILCTIISGIVIFLSFGIISFIRESVILPISIIGVSILTGVVYTLSWFFYYETLRHEDVSRCIPIFKLEAIFTLLFATIFLGEIFLPIRYAGIFLLVIGAILISIKKISGTKFKITSVLGIALITTLAFAIKDILFKYASLQANFMPIFFWMSVGGLSVSTVLLIYHHPKILKKDKTGIEHITLSACLTAVGIYLYFTAISMAPVALVSALVTIQVLFVFVIAIFLSKFNPSIISEQLKVSVIFLKTISIIIIILGTILII